MTTVQLVNDPRQAAMLAAPLRQRILEALAEPGSASTMARTLGLARQKVAYHVRQLEKHGFVELVREEQRRGCKERIVRRTAQYLVASPSVLAPGMDPRKLKDKFSSSYLIALASRMAQEVGEAHAHSFHLRRNPLAFAARARGLRRRADRGDRATRGEVPR
jgi:DNA-binding transcriptional ArsR family regulator